MEALLPTTHSQRTPRKRNFRTITRPDNKNPIRKYSQLAKITLPTEMVIGGICYGILSILKKEEKSIIGHTMVRRAREENARLGQKDGKHLLKHQGEIPVIFQENAIFVFTDWRSSERSDVISYVFYDTTNWCRGGKQIHDGNWDRRFHLLYRK